MFWALPCWEQVRKWWGIISQETHLRFSSSDVGCWVCFTWAVWKNREQIQHRTSQLPNQKPLSDPFCMQLLRGLLHGSVLNQTQVYVCSFSAAHQWDSLIGLGAAISLPGQSYNLVRSASSYLNLFQQIHQDLKTLSALAALSGLMPSELLNQVQRRTTKIKRNWPSCSWHAGCGTADWESCSVTQHYKSWTSLVLHPPLRDDHRLSSLQPVA